MRRDASESAGGGNARATRTEPDRAKVADAGAATPTPAVEAHGMHSPFAFSPRSWLTGWRLVAVGVAVMVAVGVVATVLGWYPVR